MRRNQTRRRASQALLRLDLPTPFDIDEFRRRIEADRRRPLTLRRLPTEAASAFCGIYIQTADADLVYYVAATASAHEEHIIVHELMHLVMGHGALQAPPASVGEDLARLLPGLDPSLVERALGRSGYRASEEHEAELLASMVMQGQRPAAATTPIKRLDSLLE